MAKCMVKSGVIGTILAPVYWAAVRILGRGHYKRKQNESITKAITDIRDLA